MTFFAAARLVGSFLCANICRTRTEMFRAIRRGGFGGNQLLAHRRLIHGIMSRDHVYHGSLSHQERLKDYLNQFVQRNFTATLIKRKRTSTTTTGDGPTDDEQREEGKEFPIGDHQMRGFEMTLFDQLCNENGKVPLSRLHHALGVCGIWKNDPRFANTTAKMNEMSKIARRNNLLNVEMDYETFRDLVKENIVLIKRAVTNQLVIPDFRKFCVKINGIHDSCRDINYGKVASYIPQLAKYDPKYWGVSLCTIDGQRHSVGDVSIPVTMQSSAKAINYALALNELDETYVHNMVGHEPSGESFNKIKLQTNRKPHNPLINAGAIVICSLLHQGRSPAERFDHILSQYKKINGGEFLGFNNSVFLSEKSCANRNYALGYYMQEYKCFPEGANLQETMDLYFQLCSVECDVNSAAVTAASLANGGFCPITNEQVLTASSVRNTLTLMHSCGMYDYSGAFAFKVGLPAKSAVSGLILLVVPNVMGLCLWSPPLDAMGNSVRGVKFCKELVKTFNFHQYDNLKHTVKKEDPRLRSTETQVAKVVNLLMNACNGDLTELRQIALVGQDMTMADYDNRTALHLAASEGRLDCVQFLVEKCGVPVTLKDRWGRTAYDDAKEFKREEVRSYLEPRMPKL